MSLEWGAVIIAIRSGSGLVIEWGWGGIRGWEMWVVIGWWRKYCLRDKI